MTLAAHHIELLAPAKNTEIGREAILHGADAVYIGGPGFGARHNASNEVSEIAQLVDFAHRYHAKIFVTMNTILHDAELELAARQVRQLYEAGVDALIVQDMAMLEMDLAPIQLHASTQCDIRTAEKAAFLADSGFSQLVLARELTLKQIAAIRNVVDTPLEYFVHGALCVAFSGQCYISHAHTGRSANRGDCSQACRLPYTLTDGEGRVVAYEKHLLSMKDNDQSRNLEALIDAGIRSLKIEGRYKDMAYVKNITAHYRLLLDEILHRRPELARPSSGHSTIAFSPNVDKTFHRGHTDYFANGRLEDIAAFDAPSFVGLHMGYVSKLGAEWIDVETDEVLANGDGLTYMNKREVCGIAVNSAQQNGSSWRIFPNEPVSRLVGLKVGMALNRNRDHRWDATLTKKSAERRVKLCLSLTETDQGLALDLRDEDGIESRTEWSLAYQAATSGLVAHEILTQQLAKLGNTMFVAQEVQVALARPWFVSAGSINALRRDAVVRHEAQRLASWQRPQRKAAVLPLVRYPETNLSYLANVYNEKARAFYHKHGVQLIDAAYEAHEEAGDVSLMITKHCLRFSFNLCPKQAKGVTGVQGQVKAEPMTLVNGQEKFTLKFDCKPCEMHIIGKMKKSILQSAPPVSPLVFHKTRPSAAGTSVKRVE
jgi:23S rRNA 5-hydroxycytidine C2501 synthase